jgi:hypothetical protein
MALGIVIAAGVALWAVLRRPAVRRQVDEATHNARTRFDAWRTTPAQPEEGSPEASAPGIETIESADPAPGAVVVAAGVADEASSHS